MKSFELSTSGVTVSSVILGLMRIKTMSDEEIRTLYSAARDAGINMIDHADIYGGERHLCEKRFGEAVTLSAAERDGLVIQTKTGIRKGFFDFSKEHILKSVDGFSNHVEQAATDFISDRHTDRRTGCHHFHSAEHTVGGIHRDTAGDAAKAAHVHGRARP